MTTSKQQSEFLFKKSAIAEPTAEPLCPNEKIKRTKGRIRQKVRPPKRAAP